jgi:hypothetical protein
MGGGRDALLRVVENDCPFQVRPGLPSDMAIPTAWRNLTGNEHYTISNRNKRVELFDRLHPTLINFGKLSPCAYVLL